MSSPTQEQTDDTQGNCTSQITTETNKNEHDVAIESNENDRLEGEITHAEEDEHGDQQKCAGADTTNPSNTVDKDSGTCIDDSPDVPQSIEGSVPSPTENVVQTSELEPVQDQTDCAEQNDTAEEGRSGVDVEEVEVKTDEVPAGMLSDNVAWSSA